MSHPNDTIMNLMVPKRGKHSPFNSWGDSFNRQDMAVLFNTLGYKRGAEIGVSRGAYSEGLCVAIPGLQLFCVDPYHVYEEEGGRNQARLEGHMARAQKRLSRYSATFIRKSSMDAAKDFDDGSLDFVYIDAVHSFDYCMSDIIVWAPKVKPGGIISGHDYFHAAHIGVVNAVRSYTHAHNIHPWYITRPDASDPFPSWFWVR